VVAKQIANKSVADDSEMDTGDYQFLFLRVRGHILYIHNEQQQRVM